MSECEYKGICTLRYLLKEEAVERMCLDDKHLVPLVSTLNTSIMSLGICPAFEYYSKGEDKELKLIIYKPE